MSFLNKKEQVLDIELTQYGKYMLSKGRLRPAFYIFSDDEILYNVDYAGGTKEKDKETSKRIQKETQRMVALYEHDGVESRILNLNGHDVRKIRGHGYLAQKSDRVEKIPVNQLYGTDFSKEEKMGLDDRNLVRNFLGRSSLGEQDVPNWSIDSLLDGNLNDVNISSSSPNIGIKRPVLRYEIDYNFNVEKIGSSQKGFISEDYDFLTGFEKEIIFKDNVRVVVDDGKLLLSVIEKNVPYEKLNFDYSFYEVLESKKNNKAKNVIEEELRKLYFKSFDPSSPPVIDEVERYFSVSEDMSTTLQYGHRLFGTIPIKVLEDFRESLSEHMNQQNEQDASKYVTLTEPEDDC